MEYEVEVKIWNTSNGGTSDTVYMEVIGTNGITEKVQIFAEMTLGRSHKHTTNELCDIGVPISVNVTIGGNNAIAIKQVMKRKINGQLE